MSNKYSDLFEFTEDRALKHPYFSSPLNQLCTIFRIEGHSRKSYRTFLTLVRLRRGSLSSFSIGMTPITPSLSSAYCVIVHERIYSIRRCFKGRPTSSRQPLRATVAEKASSHSCTRVSLRQVTMLPEGVFSSQTAAFGGCVRSEEVTPECSHYAEVGK